MKVDRDAGKAPSRLGILMATWLGFSIPLVALSIFGAPKLKPEGFKTAEAYHQAQLPFIFHHYLSILLLPLLVLVGSVTILFAYNQGRSHPRP